MQSAGITDFIKQEVGKDEELVVNRKEFDNSTSSGRLMFLCGQKVDELV